MEFRKRRKKKHAKKMVHSEEGVTNDEPTVFVEKHWQSSKKKSDLLDKKTKSNKDEMMNKNDNDSIDQNMNKEGETHGNNNAIEISDNENENDNEDDNNLKFKDKDILYDENIDDIDEKYVSNTFNTKTSDCTLCCPQCFTIISYCCKKLSLILLTTFLFYLLFCFVCPCTKE